MMHFHDLFLVLCAYFSELLGTLSGLGSSMIFVPVASWVEKFQFVLALTAILHCFANLSRIILFRAPMPWAAFWRLAIPSIVFTIVGALLTTATSTETLQKALGLLLILFSLIFLLRTQQKSTYPKWITILLSSLSGFTTGLLGTGSAFRGLALQSLQVEKNIFILLSSSIDFWGDFSRMLIYFYNGFMDWNQWPYIPLLVLAAYGGTKTGKYLLKYLNQKIFDHIVVLFIFLSGVSMLISTK